MCVSLVFSSQSLASGSLGDFYPLSACCLKHSPSFLIHLETVRFSVYSLSTLLPGSLSLLLLLLIFIKGEKYAHELNVHCMDFSYLVQLCGWH